MPQRRFQPNLSASRDRRGGGTPVANAPVRNRTVETPHGDDKSDSEVCASNDELPPVDPPTAVAKTSAVTEQPPLAVDTSPVPETMEQLQAENGDTASPNTKGEAMKPPVTKRGQWVRKKVAPKVTPAGERRSRQREEKMEVEKAETCSSPAGAEQDSSNGKENVSKGLENIDATTLVSPESFLPGDNHHDNVPEPATLTTREHLSAGLEDMPGVVGRVGSPVSMECVSMPDSNGVISPVPVAVVSPAKTPRGSGKTRTGKKGGSRQRATSSEPSPSSGQGTVGRKRSRKAGPAAEEKETGSTETTASPSNREESVDHMDGCRDDVDGAASPVKKTKKKEMTSKRRKALEVASARLQQFHDAPDRSSMTMQQLIYYNPSSNPMKQSERRKKAAIESERSRTCSPHAVDRHEGNDAIVNGRSPKADDDEGGGTGRLVPQLKIAADGTIEVDADSMLVESASASFLEETRNSQAIVEDDDYTTSTSFRAKHRSKKWSETETSSFYEALMKVGTDFTMMTLLLPKRSRKELKNKFKKEEKSNPLRVTRAMNKLCSKS